MEKLTAWEKFIETGSVLDYLRYKAEKDFLKETAGLEVHDRRVDHKIDEYR